MRSPADCFFVAFVAAALIALVRVSRPFRIPVRLADGGPPADGTDCAAFAGGARKVAERLHPEIDERSFAARWLAYAEKYPPADLPRGAAMSDAPFLKTLRPSPHASAILRRFALLVAGH